MPGEYIDNGISIPNTGQSVISNNSSNGSVLYPKYTSGTKLYKNQQFSVNLKLKDKDIKWKFGSQLSLFYSTIDKVRMDCGGLIDGVFNDYTIATLIYLNSKECKAVYDIAMSGAATTSTQVSIYLKNWTRYKTDVDLLTEMWLHMVGRVGTFNKKVGLDISITEQTSLPRLEELLREYKAKLKEADIMIRNVSFAVKSATRAGSKTYTERTSF
jgi:hypothetical protein